MSSLNNSLNDKYQQLMAAIKSKEKVVVAFSGGVDSALLAKIAYDALGANAWAVLVDSETVPGYELECASALATELGFNYEIVKMEQLSDEDFNRNTPNRCYFCRKGMAEQLLAFAKDKGIKTIIAGAQASDLSDHRPGIKAFDEAGIWHPLIELKFSKDEVRQLGRHLDLPVSEKPSMACLSSRVPYGQQITSEVLNMIANAEEYLRELGFTQYRARTHDKMIRIEIDTEEFDNILKHRDQIIEKMKELGYLYVTLDLEGFKSGSMNEELKNKKMLRKTTNK